MSESINVRFISDQDTVKHMAYSHHELIVGVRAC